MEQHEAAQDWLRDQVKSLAAPPEDREGLHGAANTLKVSKRCNHCCRPGFNVSHTTPGRPALVKAPTISSSSLQALLLTVDREQREMKELDLARDSLMNLCSSGGRDALALAVGHLHDLCDTSEQELRGRLAACEAALAERDGQLTRRSQALKERAAAIQWELRSLDQALGPSEPQNHVGSLQRRWSSLQVTPTPLSQNILEIIS